MKRKLACIFLDAFSSRYLEHTSFLRELAEKGYYSELESMFGFQCIGAAIFTGTLPNTNKVWCDYVINNGQDFIPKSFIKLIEICDMIPNDNLNKYSRYILSRMFNINLGTPNIIPPYLLNAFSLKLKKNYDEENVFEDIITIFEQLKSHELNYYSYGISGTISDRITQIKFDSILKKNYDFVIIKFGSLDRIGHRYGPNSDQILKQLLFIDNMICDIINIYRDYCFIIFSDHGMTSVKNYVNIFDYLNKSSFKINSDYRIFVNSTLANFWFKNLDIKNEITEILENIIYGDVLPNEKLKELGIDHIGKEYGELIFALKEGNVFFPDFYRKNSPPRGMHGYAYSSYDKPIFLICQTNDLRIDTDRKNVRHIDIMPTILDLLDVPIPHTCEGKSILNKE